MSVDHPLSDIQIRDPFVVADAVTQRYLLYGTSGFGEAGHGGFGVRTSRDLKTWSEPQPALAPAAGPVGATHFWAPEVQVYRAPGSAGPFVEERAADRKADGRWYLFGTFMHGTEMTKPERRYTRIYVADTPAGPFAPLANGPITPPGWWSIDGTLHVDARGTPWLVFVREWLQVNDGEMHAVELTPDLLRAAGASRRLFRASEAAWSLPQTWDKFSGYRVTDGPWLHRLNSGVLLMLWSTFGKGGYLTGVARSANGEVTGPWVQAPAPLFAADGGHPMLFRTFGGQLMMALHTPNKVGAERAKFLPVRETKDGLELA